MVLTLAPSMNLIGPPNTKILIIYFGLLTSESCHLIRLTWWKLCQLWSGYDLPLQS